MERNEYYKKMRQFAKEEQRCIQCGEQDAFTLNGRSHCSRCAERARIADKKRYSKERHQKTVDKWKAQNRCARCGGQLPPGRKICKRCVAKTNSRLRERKIQDGMNWPRGSNGICWTCNKLPVMEGKKICAECYEKTMIAQRKATEWHKHHKKEDSSASNSIAVFWLLQRREYGWLKEKQENKLLSQKSE